MSEIRKKLDNINEKAGSKSGLQPTLGEAGGDATSSVSGARPRSQSLKGSLQSPRARMIVIGALIVAVGGYGLLKRFRSTTGQEPATTVAPVDPKSEKIERAVMKLKTRGEEDSIADFEALSKEMPDRADVQGNLAAALLLNGQNEKAHSLLLELVEKFPKDRSIRANLAEAEFRIGKTDEALERIRTYLLTNENDVEELLHLGLLSEKSGRLAGAASAYAIYIRKNPRDERIQALKDRVRWLRSLAAAPPEPTRISDSKGGSHEPL